MPRGGPRPNSGGARPGAGRPKKKQEPIASVAARQDDPKAFLLTVMNDVTADGKLRVDAAKALMPYMHERKGAAAVGGKKAQAEQAAQTAERGTTWSALLQ